MNIRGPLASIRRQDWTKDAVLVLALLILFNIPLWFLRYLPLADYPSHLLSIQIAKEYDNPAFNFPEYFVVDWRPLPNLGSEFLILTLARFMPVETAGRVYLSLFAVLFVLSVFYLLRAVDPRKTPLGLAGFFFVYNWYFNQGYLNFWGSIPLYFLTLGYWLRSPGLAAPRERVFFALLVCATYLFHLFSWLMVVGSIGLLVIFDRDNRRKLGGTLVAFIPSLLLFAYYFLVLQAGGSTRRGIIFDSPLGNALFAATHSAIFFSKPGLLVWVLPFGLLAGLVLWANLFRRRRQSPRERSLFWLVCCLVLLYFVLPVQISAVWPFNLRVNVFAVVLALATIPVDMIVVRKKALRFVTACLAVVVWAYVYNGYQGMSRKIETYVSGVGHIRPNSTILPLTTDVSGGWATGIPLSTTWAYYHIAKGGAGPYLFDLPHGQIVNYRRPKREVFPAPSLYPHRVEDYDPDRHARPYDYVILWGRHERIEQSLARDFHPIFENGPLRLYEKTRPPKAEEQVKSLPAGN